MTVIIDGVVVGTTTANSLGSWTFVPPSPLADGSHTVSARATDPAGNVGMPSPNTSFGVDTQPPAAPIVTSPTGGGTTTNPPTFTGTAEAGSFVQITVDGVVVATVLTDSNGMWTWTSPSPIVDGPHTMSAIAIDRAGNESPPSTPVSFTTVSANADGGVDGGPGDAGAEDAGFSDGGLLDAGLLDAGLLDAGLIDAGLIDAGSGDAGSTDAGSGDAGSTDAGTADAGALDAGQPDAGSDAGAQPELDYAGGGCGCSTPGADGPWLFALLAVLFSFRPRRVSPSP